MLEPYDSALVTERAKASLLSSLVSDNKAQVQNVETAFRLSGGSGRYRPTREGVRPQSPSQRTPVPRTRSARSPPGYQMHVAKPVEAVQLATVVANLGGRTQDGT